MLASTVQFSSYERPPPTTRRLPTTPTPHHGAQAPQHGNTGTAGGSPRDGAEETRPNGPIPQDPTACQAPTPPHPPVPTPHPPPTNGTGSARAVLGPAAAAGAN